MPNELPSDPPQQPLPKYPSLLSKLAEERKLLWAKLAQVRERVKLSQSILKGRQRKV